VLAIMKNPGSHMLMSKSDCKTKAAFQCIAGKEGLCPVP